MVRDAELHAEEDKKRREAVEAKNTLDSLIYSTEKSMSELGAKFGDDDKATINAAIAEAKKSLDSADVSTIKAATEALNKASHKLTEELYKKASAGSAEAGPDGADSGAKGSADSNGAKKSGDDVVDADFEEVRDN